MSDDGEKFLSRWSRLKRETETVEPDGAELSSPAQDAAAPLQRQEKDARAQKDARADSVPPQLPPVDTLTPDSDFRGFLHPKVDEGVKRAALKKLFADPHFNVMDGLDTYIDDYSKGEPLPVEMLAQMKSAQKIFRWARNELEEGETAPVALNQSSTPAVLETRAPAGETIPIMDESTAVAPEPLPEAAGAQSPDSDHKQ